MDQPCSITSPRFVKNTTSPWLPFRCLWPSLLWISIGVATSRELASPVWPKLLANSPCWNKLKGAWWHIEALKSCSLTGTPDVATAQQGLNTSIEPLTTDCSAPFPPTTYKMRLYFITSVAQTHFHHQNSSSSCTIKTVPISIQN